MKSRIEAIRNKVLNGQVLDRDIGLFAGADLIITPEPIVAERGEVVVVTEHAVALSSLIFELQGACSDWLDYLNKYDFYPSLGLAANAYLSKASDLQGLLVSVIDAAFVLEDKHNRFLYFAYGSNMDEAQMARRCPDAEMLAKVTIPGYRFALDEAGVATILPAKGSHVEGLLWTVPCFEEVIPCFETDGESMDVYLACK